MNRKKKTPENESEIERRLRIRKKLDQVHYRRCVGGNQSFGEKSFVRDQQVKKLKANNDELAKALADQRLQNKTWFDEVVFLKKQLYEKKLIANYGNTNTLIEDQLQSRIREVAEPLNGSINEAMEKLVGVIESLGKVKVLVGNLTRGGIRKVEEKVVSPPAVSLPLQSGSRKTPFGGSGSGTAPQQSVVLPMVEGQVLKVMSIPMRRVTAADIFMRKQKQRQEECDDINMSIIGEQTQEIVAADLSSSAEGDALMTLSEETTEEDFVLGSLRSNTKKRRTSVLFQLTESDVNTQKKSRRSTSEPPFSRTFERNSFGAQQLQDSISFNEVSNADHVPNNANEEDPLEGPHWLYKENVPQIKKVEKHCEQILNSTLQFHDILTDTEVSSSNIGGNLSTMRKTFIAEDMINLGEQSKMDELDCTIMSQGAMMTRFEELEERGGRKARASKHGRSTGTADFMGFMTEDEMEPQSKKSVTPPWGKALEPQSKKSVTPPWGKALEPQSKKSVTPPWGKALEPQSKKSVTPPWGKALAQPIVIDTHKNERTPYDLSLMEASMESIDPYISIKKNPSETILQKESGGVRLREISVLLEDLVKSPNTSHENVLFKSHDGMTARRTASRGTLNYADCSASSEEDDDDTWRPSHGMTMDCKNKGKKNASGCSSSYVSTRSKIKVVSDDVALEKNNAYTETDNQANLQSAKCEQFDCMKLLQPKNESQCNNETPTTVETDETNANYCIDTELNALKYKKLSVLDTIHGVADTEMSSNTNVIEPLEVAKLDEDESFECEKNVSYIVKQFSSAVNDSHNGHNSQDEKANCNSSMRNSNSGSAKLGQSSNDILTSGLEGLQSISNAALEISNDNHLMMVGLETIVSQVDPVTSALDDVSKRRRTVLQVTSYREPSLNVKMRRGNSDSKNKVVSLGGRKSEGKKT